jgi:hypothetical protein
MYEEDRIVDLLPLTTNNTFTLHTLKTVVRAINTNSWLPFGLDLLLTAHNKPRMRHLLHHAQ